MSVYDRSADTMRKYSVLDKLREFIYDNKFKQYEVANYLGCTKSQVCHWLREDYPIGKAWETIINIKISTGPKFKCSKCGCWVWENIPLCKICNRPDETTEA